MSIPNFITRLKQLFKKKDEPWYIKVQKLAAAKVLTVEEADIETAAWRLAICQECPRFIPESAKCSLCGCFMESKVQIKVSRTAARPMGELTHCPEGRWNDLDLVNYYRQLDGKDQL